MVVIDGVAAGVTPEETAIREAVVAEMEGKTVVMSLTTDDAARTCDHVIMVSDDGTAKDGAPASMLDPAE